MFDIRAMKDGFRRAGRAFTKIAEVFEDDCFTPEQVAALEADPMIEIRHIPDPPKPNPDPDDDTDGVLINAGISHPVSSLIENAEARKVLEGMKLHELKKDCDSIGIKYPANATKKDLVDLILKNTAPPPEE